VQVLDVAGDWVSLGGVDLQINGALGLAFTDLETHHIEFLQDICQFYGSRGGCVFTNACYHIYREHSAIAIHHR
jgi:N-acetylglucosamine-6-phosphate deacetylase